MNENNKNSRPRLSDDKLTVDYNREDFSENLPNLTRELTDQENPGRIPIKDLKFEDKVPKDPGVEDFIRRCNKKKQAHEIIDFMEKQQQISEKKANECRKILKEKGLKAFGSHKSHGYYEREYRRNKKFNQY
jgi:hypothetical protein